MPAVAAFRERLNPFRGILMAFPIALFSSALISDIAYLKTAQMQWSNFSAWLIVGALVFGGLAGLWAIVNLALAWRGPTRNAALIHLAALALAWIFGLINAFKHSQDAWSSVGAFGVILSILCTILVLVAGWTAYAARESVR